MDTITSLSNKAMEAGSSGLAMAGNGVSGITSGLKETYKAVEVIFWPGHILSL